MLSVNRSTNTDSICRRYYEPSDTYENKHRWDPKAQWTPEEQSKLTRRLDIRVTAVACLCFAALQLDRGNVSGLPPQIEHDCPELTYAIYRQIGNALSDGMLKDLHLTTNDCEFRSSRLCCACSENFLY
jgi:hypothetical protein